MSKIIKVGFPFYLIFISAFSQVREQNLLVKRIEYNFYFEPPNVIKENLNGKEGLERLFFGNLNSPVEFSFLPSAESPFNGQLSGFRILRNLLNTAYVLEVKYISNYEEANEEASRKYPSISLGSEAAYISVQRRDQIAEHNRTAFKRQCEEQLKRYEVKSLTFPLNNQFAEKMHERMVSVIDDYKINGELKILPDVGSSVFRTVVDDEVWTLKINNPKGDVLKMFNLCREIIADAKANKLDEKSICPL